MARHLGPYISTHFNGGVERGQRARILAVLCVYELDLGWHLIVIIVRRMGVSQRLEKGT